MQHQIPHYLPRTTLQRNLDIIYAAQQRQRTKISSPLAAPTQSALSPVHKTEGQGTFPVLPHESHEVIDAYGFPVPNIYGAPSSDCSDPPQAHQAEGRGTSNLTPEKVQRLVRTCGVYPIAKMLAKRGYTCREARALIGV